MNPNYPNTRSKTPIIVAAVVAALVLAAILTVLSITRNSGKTFVRVITVPSNMEVLFNDKKMKVSGGGVRVDAGNYQVTGKKEGFSTFNSELKVEDDRESTIVITLAPESEEAEKWANRNQNAYLKAEQVAGELNREKGEEFRDKNPILSKIPFDSGYYRIDYTMAENSDQVILEVRSDSEVGRRVAIEKIVSWGFNPGDFKINFIGVDNPFSEAGSR